MQTEPDDLSSSDLLILLERWWGIDVTALTYAPVGSICHHWNATDSDGRHFFLTAHELYGAGSRTKRSSRLAELNTLYRATLMLREQAQLEFVVAPLLDSTGNIFHIVGRRYAVVVFAYVESICLDYCESRSDNERRAVLLLLRRLHAVAPTMLRTLVQREDFSIRYRAELDAALETIDNAWDGGPYAECCRNLLREYATPLRRLFALHDDLCAQLGEPLDSWVLTHGDLHAGNIIRTGNGALALIDWETLLIAPRERDLVYAGTSIATDWRPYSSEASQPLKFDPGAFQLYQMRWPLAEVAKDVSRFRKPHADTADSQRWWQDFVTNLEDARRRLEPG